MTRMRAYSWSVGVPLFDNSRSRGSLGHTFHASASKKTSFADDLLLKAVKKGSRLRADIAIMMGANIEALDSQPLLTAAEKGDVTMIEMLLKAGAKVEGLRGEYYKDRHENTDYDTPLRRAIRNGHLEAVKTLMDRGARLQGWTWSAEQDALDSGHIELLPLIKARNPLSSLREIRKRFLLKKAGKP